MSRNIEAIYLDCNQLSKTKSRELVREFNENFYSRTEYYLEDEIEKYSDVGFEVDNNRAENDNKAVNKKTS